MTTAYANDADVPPTVHRVRDAEGGSWRRVKDSDTFSPEFPGVPWTLAEIIDYLGHVAEDVE